MSPRIVGASDPPLNRSQWKASGNQDLGNVFAVNGKQCLVSGYCDGIEFQNRFALDLFLAWKIRRIGRHEVTRRVGIDSLNASLFLFVLFLAPNQTTTYITEIRKQEFIHLLQTLPHKGEFYTDDAIAKAGPYLPTLFALTRNRPCRVRHLSFWCVEPRPVSSFRAS